MASFISQLKALEVKMSALETGEKNNKSIK